MRTPPISINTHDRFGQKLTRRSFLSQTAAASVVPLVAAALPEFATAQFVGGGIVGWWFPSKCGPFSEGDVKQYFQGNLRMIPPKAGRTDAEKQKYEVLEPKFQVNLKKDYLQVWVMQGTKAFLDPSKIDGGKEITQLGLAPIFEFNIPYSEINKNLPTGANLLSGNSPNSQENKNAAIEAAKKIWGSPEYGPKVQKVVQAEHERVIQEPGWTFKGEHKALHEKMKQEFPNAKCHNFGIFGMTVKPTR